MSQLHASVPFYSGQGPYVVSGQSAILSGLRIRQTEPQSISVRFSELTAKEKELLRFMSSGLLYKEIASAMKISLDTVKKHCSNIYKKLNVQNNIEAINLYNKY